MTLTLPTTVLVVVVDGCGGCGGACRLPTNSLKLFFTLCAQIHSGKNKQLNDFPLCLITIIVLFYKFYYFELDAFIVCKCVCVCMWLMHKFLVANLNFNAYFCSGLTGDFFFFHFCSFALFRDCDYYAIEFLCSIQYTIHIRTWQFENALYSLYRKQLRCWLLPYEIYTVSFSCLNVDYCICMCLL